MNDIILESFLNYCDDMIIANETMTKEKFDRMKKDGHIKPVNEIVDYKPLPSKEIVNALKKIKSWSDMKQPIEKMSLNRIAKCFTYDVYAEDFEKISGSEFHKICVAIRPFQKDMDPIGMNISDSKYKTMFESLQMVIIGALGNGDYYIYSVKNKKMYESYHDGKELIVPLMRKGKHLSFDEWKKEDAPINASESFFDVIANEASFRRGCTNITMTLDGKLESPKDIDKNEEFDKIVDDLKKFVRKINKRKVFNEIKTRVLEKNKSWANSVGWDRPLTDKQIESGIDFDHATISAYDASSVTLWVKVRNWGKMNDSITDVECFLKEDGSINYMNIHND